MIFFRNWNESQYSYLRDLTGDSLLEIIYEITPKPSAIFDFVYWMGQPLDVDVVIERIMTDMGGFAPQTAAAKFLKRIVGGSSVD